MPTTLRCDPKLFEKDLSGQVAIVTGANSGIGLETARQLSKQGATVIVACRSEEKGTAAAEDIGGTATATATATGSAKFLTTLDLASLESVRAFAKAFQDAYDRLDILVNNAGIMACDAQKTEDGFEMQFGVNHLGHFLLMRLLTPMLVATAKTTQKPSRFLAVSSVAAAESSMAKSTPKIDFDDPMFETRDYDPGTAYGQSKLANYLHALEASRRIPPDQLISTSNHPGWVYTPLDKHIAARMLGTGTIAGIVGAALRRFFLLSGHMIRPEDGGIQTSLHCILDDDVESGKYYAQFGIFKDESCQAGGWPLEMPNPNATVEAAEKLWEVSDKLVGL
eukprot:jgi/Psemu1/3391/gm1.3391_g